MLTKRIIPCLDIQNGRVVKGVSFQQIQDAGDPVELALRYEEAGADELVFLDISASIEDRNTFPELVKSIAEVLSIPFTVGGGISSVENAKELLHAGADKVSVNSAAVRTPKLIKEIALHLGSQCLVVAIDVKRVGQYYEVFVKGGREATGILLTDWLSVIQELGAGEVLLTSIDRDGQQSGFDTDLYALAGHHISVPLIASGGAGNTTDFSTVLSLPKVDAALAAGIFHRDELPIPLLKKELSKQLSIRI